MNKYNLLKFYYVFLLTIPVFSNMNDSYQNKEYGAVLKESSLLLEKTFKKILSESYKELPFSRQMTASNHTYSFDMQKNHVNYNTEIEYVFNYDSKNKLKISLVYSVEEVSYYKAYINNAKHSTVSSDVPTFPLKNSNQGFYLWNISESTVYYVYQFESDKNNPIRSIEVIPGLLFKIQFNKDSKHSDSLDNIINQLITNTNWKKLEQLYALN